VTVSSVTYSPRGLQVDRSYTAAVINGRRIVVILPAYNAARTLEATYRDLPHDVVDEVVLTDDASRDETVALSKRLGITTFGHERNLGYGGNQKTCYREAIRRGADIVVMVHPDYQYTPRLVTAMASLIAFDVYDVALGSRILGNGARSGGMPLYKYVANRVLTLLQNLMLGQKLSEYHTGFRAYSRTVLETLPLEENSNDFVFDNQVLVQVFRFGFRVGEVSCPTRYFAEASSINFRRSVIYGLGCLWNCVRFNLARAGIHEPPFLSESGRRLGDFQHASSAT
jgi:glycosyltransferase involved in cell wall biosynthesis